jgi:hypothetical protein
MEDRIGNSRGSVSDNLADPHALIGVTLLSISSFHLGFHAPDVAIVRHMIVREAVDNPAQALAVKSVLVEGEINTSSHSAGMVRTISLLEYWSVW